MKYLGKMVLAAAYAAAQVSAGQIPITAVNGSNVGLGLTSSYISGTATSCAGYRLTGATCLFPGAATGNERTYDVSLFQSVNTGTVNAPAMAVPYAGYNATASGAQTAGSTITDWPCHFRHVV